MSGVQPDDTCDQASGAPTRPAAALELAPQRTPSALPGGAGARLEAVHARELIESRLQHRGGCRELLGGRVAARDHDRGRLGALLAHSGMFPCFLGGSDARLVRSARSALMITRRVAAGSMIPSS